MGLFSSKKSKAEAASRRELTKQLIAGEEAGLRKAKEELKRRREINTWSQDREASRYLTRQAENAVDAHQHNLRELRK